MIKREDLLQTEEYWFEVLQNEIYRIVADFMDKEGLNQTQLAERLGVSKGYISQILNGNFNFTLKKLVELSVAVNIAPSIDFKNLNEYIQQDKKQRFEARYMSYFKINAHQSTIPIHSGITGIFGKVESSGEPCCLKIA